MAGRRWTGDHLEAVSYALGGLFLAVFLPLGVGLGGPSGLAFVAVVVVVFALLAWRSWRRAESPWSAGAEESVEARGSVEAQGSAAAQESAGAPSADGAGRAPVADAPSRWPARPASAPVPRLSDEGRRELARIVEVLGAAGLFTPRVPDPADLEEVAADRGEPVEVASVLGGLEEVPYWRPGFRAEDHRGALAEDGWKGEQLPETLHAAIDGLGALVADVLEVRLEALELQAEGRFLRHRLTLLLGADRVVLDYLGDHKWLSTVPHVAVARAVHATGAPVRLATYGDDQTMWIVALRGEATVERLNADLGPAAPDPWEWLDEQEPFAAGEFRLYR